MTRLKRRDADFPRTTTDGEAAQLVTLCARQIEAAFVEASADIDRLSLALLDAARHGNTLLAGVTDSTPEASPTADQLELDSQVLQQALSSASSRLQFADRLQQRLSNVAKNLTGLAELMKSPNQPITDSQWRECLQMTRARFTMAQERQMFDAAFDLPQAQACTPSKDVAASQQPVLFDAEGVENESG